MMKLSRPISNVMLLLIVSMIFTIGCSSKPKHPDKGPHEGSLAELGEEEYHAEMILNPDRQQVTIYLLDATAKSAVPIADTTKVELLITDGDKKETLSLKPAQIPGEAAGQASSFVGAHDLLEKEVDPKSVEVRLKINDKPYLGRFGH